MESVVKFTIDLFDWMSSESWIRVKAVLVMSPQWEAIKLLRGGELMAVFVIFVVLSDYVRLERLAAQRIQLYIKLISLMNAILFCFFIWLDL